MIQKNTIDQYRNTVSKHIGEKVSLYLKKGRRMITINDCYIENAYRSIFVIKICGKSLINESRISVSYADLLIGNARLIVKNNMKLA